MHPHPPESWLPPALLSVASGFLAVAQGNEVALIGYTLSSLWFGLAVYDRIIAWKRHAEAVKDKS